MGGVLSGANQTVSVVNNGVSSAATYSKEQIAFLESFLKNASRDRELIDEVKNLVFPEAYMRRLIVLILVSITAMSAYFIAHHYAAESEEERANVKFTKAVIFGDSGVMNFLFQTMVVVSMFLMIRRALKVMSSSAVIANAANEGHVTRTPQNNVWSLSVQCAPSRASK